MPFDENESVIEKTSDLSDTASAFEAMQIKNSLDNHHNKMKQPLSHDFDGKHCVECDDEIPNERLKIIRTDKCVYCADLKKNR